MINMDAGVRTWYVIYRRFRPQSACFGCGSMGFQHSPPTVMAKPGDYFSFLEKLTHLRSLLSPLYLKLRQKLKNFSSLRYILYYVDHGYQKSPRH